MIVTVLYFASLREAIGISRETVELPPDIATIASLRDWLGQRHAALLTAKNLRAAVNQNMVALSAGVADGDEVAFFPPVTGG